MFLLDDRHQEGKARNQEKDAAEKRQHVPCPPRRGDEEQRRDDKKKPPRENPFHRHTMLVGDG